MNKFVFLSLIFMGWAFYEMTGGNEFVPQEPARIAKYKAIETERAEAARELERKHKAATAEKARERKKEPVAAKEEERVAMQVAALELTETDATLEQASLVTQTPLTQRKSLYPTSVPPVAPETPVPSLATMSAVEPQPTEPLTIFQPKDPSDLRQVRGTRANMRGGPGTSYAVLSTLNRGDEVEVLKQSENGWVKLKVLDTGRIGWMSAKLLNKVE